MSSSASYQDAGPFLRMAMSSDRDCAAKMDGARTKNMASAVRIKMSGVMQIKASSIRAVVSRGRTEVKRVMSHGVTTMSSGRSASTSFAWSAGARSLSRWRRTQVSTWKPRRLAPW